MHIPPGGDVHSLVNFTSKIGNKRQVALGLKKLKQKEKKEIMRNPSPYQCVIEQGHQSHNEKMVLFACMKFSEITMRGIRYPNDSSQSKVLITVTQCICHNFSSNQILHTE